MRGGKNEERLYLFDHSLLNVERTNMPNMSELVARHEARYHLAAFLARPGMKVLDFPCGSGYGAKILKDVDYVGMDIDDITVEYANRFYAGRFYVDDMTDPKKIGDNQYDLICCIEGLEHIEMQYQPALISTFHKALVDGGRLFVSMPEAKGASGPSKTNPYHLGELSDDDFRGLLTEHFFDVQVYYHEDTLHNGNQAICMYGICRK